MNSDILIGNYHIPATHFYKWGKEVNLDISKDSASASIYNIFTKETISDTLKFIKSDNGDLIRLEGRFIVVKRSLKLKIFINEKEHGLIRNDVLEKFRVKGKYSD